MAVNLTGIELSGAASSPAQKTSPSPAVPAGSEQTDAHKGDVSITSTAALLARLQQSLSSRPAVDADRVDAIRKALASGTYAVQPGKIAGSLAHLESALAALPREPL